jgi:hypothetical protein
MDAETQLREALDSFRRTDELLLGRDFNPALHDSLAAALRVVVEENELLRVAACAAPSEGVKAIAEAAIAMREEALSPTRNSFDVDDLTEQLDEAIAAFLASLSRAPGADSQVQHRRLLRSMKEPPRKGDPWTEPSIDERG